MAAKTASKTNPANSSDYQIINGQKYDKDLLTLAKKFGKGGDIDIAEAKKLWGSAMDGKKVTVTERKTLQYIMAKNKVTDEARTFLLGKLGFEEIKGQRYDRDLLMIARASMKDGLIEVPEAKKLWKSAMDGKKVTELEAKTLRYILKEFKTADDAKAYLADKMGLEEIKGQWYERDLLRIAREGMADGNIDLAEAKKIWKAAMDGKRVTQIEAKTLRYIIITPQYKAAEDAKQFLKTKLKEAIAKQLEEEGELEAEPWMMNLDEGEIEEGDEEGDDDEKPERPQSPFDPLAKLLKGGTMDRTYAMNIVKSYGLALAYTPQEFRDDPELVMEAVRANGLALKYASPRLRNNKQIVVAAVNGHPAAIQYAGEDIVGERSSMLEVVQSRGSALSHVAEPLKADRELVIQAVKSDGHALEHAAEELKTDREVVMEAVKSKGYALQYAAAKLKADRELVMAAVRSNGSALEFASEELKADRDFAMEVVQSKAYTLLYVAEALKADRELVLEACRIDPFAYEHASTDLSRRLANEITRPKGRLWCVHTKKYI